MKRLLLIISVLTFANSVLCQNLDNGYYTKFLQENQNAVDTTKKDKIIVSTASNGTPVYFNELSKQEKADRCMEAVVGDSTILYMCLPGSNQMITSEYIVLDDNDMRLRTVEINNRIRKYTGYQITGLCLCAGGGVLYGLSTLPKTDTGKSALVIAGSTAVITGAIFTIVSIFKLRTDKLYVSPSGIVYKIR